MPASGKPQRALSLVLLSLLAAPISWAALIASGRASATVLSEGASNAMFAWLWIGAVLAAVGLVLGILAVRAPAAKRLPGIVALLLNLANLAVFAVLGLFWVLMSL